MNPAAIPVLSVVLSLAAAVGATYALRSSDAAPDAPSVADLQRTVDGLRHDQQQLLARLDAMAKAPAPVAAPAGVERAAVPPLGSEQIAAAVEAYLQKRAPTTAGAGGAAAAAAAQFDLDTELGLLRGVSYDANPELWKRLHASGKGNEAIARLEALVKQNPKDLKAQMDLANACLSYMRLETGQYQLAIRADKAFDDVLAQDDKHWEARFTKAVSYSFWPPITGKPKQAIAHLEQLVAQQESMPARAQEAQTYLILGNLLETTDPARAREIWQKGARRHPDNVDLANRLK